MSSVLRICPIQVRFLHTFRAPYADGILLAIDVIGCLLRENPQNRCSMAAILGHPWFNEC